MELRIPEKVSEDDCIKKYNRHEKLKFIEREVEFFDMFSEENKLLYHSNLDNFWMDDYNVPYFRITNSNGVKVTIVKLEDDWYLISDYIPIEGTNVEYEFYICDEWEEVLGYLSTNHNFKL